jgi:hypothetical protein
MISFAVALSTTMSGRLRTPGMVALCRPLLVAYGTLYVIASSGDGTPTSVGSGNINFADGSQQAFSFNSFDWCNG